MSIEKTKKERYTRLSTTRFSASQVRKIQRVRRARKLDSDAQALRHIVDAYALTKGEP